MYENFIFSGYGFVTGEYKITNQEIDQLIDQNYFSGLDKERINNSDKYKAYKGKNKDASAFDYMAEGMMGFKNRFHVVPFPPRAELYEKAQTSLDLLVDAIQFAFDDSGVHPEDVSAWIMGTATPHEMAPGIAETAKCFFTKLGNRSQTMTTTSACVGFNINIERAVNYLKSHPEANHIVVAHTEVMSNLLLEENDFVPFTTFGDGAAAVVVSRVKSEIKEGIIDVVNYEDMAMIDFLGADRKGNLIMDPRMVKHRAVPNIVQSAQELLAKQDWTVDSIDLFIPHQTGNAIVHSAGEKLGINPEKVFQEVQLEFGNLSGASIPASFAYLKQTNRLNAGMKIVTSVTGLGGELGGFSYIVPEKAGFEPRNNDLVGKTALVTGCTGGLGGEISQQLAHRGCRVIMQYNSNQEKAEALLGKLSNQQFNHLCIKANFADANEVDMLIEKVKYEAGILNFLVNTVAVTGSLSKASEVSDDEMEKVELINHLNQARLTEGLTKILAESVLFTGSIAQDAQFSGSSSYVASKRGLFGFAAGYARTHFPNLKCVYYIPGVIDGGMTSALNQAQIQGSMMAVGQKKIIPLKDIATRMVKSLYIPKVAKVRTEYHGVLTVCKDSYTKY